MTAYLPGPAHGDHVRKGGPNGPPDPNSYVAHSSSGGVTAVMFALRRPGFTPGTSPDELLEVYEKAPFVDRPRKYDVTGRTPVTLGGRPGLEVRLREKPDLWDDTPQKAEFFREKNQTERERVAREGAFVVALITTNGEWVYAVSLDRKGQEPAADVVKTVSESIKFH